MTWLDEAACRDNTGGADWFADTRGGVDEPALLAIEICRGCPVADRCLEHAQRQPERYGIWGGVTAAERQSQRRLRSIPTGAPVIRNHGTNSGYLAHRRYRQDACAACKKAHSIQQQESRRRRNARRKAQQQQ